jgi:alpha-mannosidase
MIISRQDKGLFNWVAPDGSKVLTYSSDHYYNSYIKLKEGFFETVTHLADLSDFWGKYYSPDVQKPVVPVLSDADMALPDMYFDYIDSWNALKKSGGAEGQNIRLPDLEHTTALQFMQDAKETGADFPTIQGERPNVWLYIHGPSHFEALRAGRSAGLTLPAAEKFSSLRCMVEGSWDSYPQERLTRAWESGIYPDHGWGGKHGDITDSTFLAKFSEADLTGRTITREAIEGIAKLVKLNENGIPVVVFNSLSWNRTDPVTLSASWPDKEVRNFVLMDSDDNPVPYQLLSSPQYYASGYLKTAEILFVACDVPSMGYSTYYICKTRGRLTHNPEPANTDGTISTPFYDVVFSDGGMSSLLDKELNREVWLADQFTAGELFTMQSIGNGAGEFADVQQPDINGFERLKGQTSGWKLIENGLLRTVIETESVMKHNRCKITWTIYKTIKRIDVRADLIDWDGTAYREFRLAFPAKLDHPELSYEVPFGVVRVGKDELQQAAGERYVTPSKDVHPRGINNWFSASDKNLGITISSSVAVWDYVNMTDLPSSATMLQPILLASRQSCHGEGPLYHQKGSHSMGFSIFSHKPGWENGFHQALQANEPLIVVVNPKRENGSLPEHYSFIELNDSNTLISTIKKEEFGEGLIIRLYDTRGEDKNLKIRHRFNTPVVFKTNLIEEEPVAVQAERDLIELKIGHNSIETLLLRK